ncbi:hypothetical protein E2C01_067533 [Portunus trituberculatus]|uniref:Uncharacterized protein n=1 Tax=Portunus trituberculatus TaxID=210409 RepID=A0A5B7HK15_PORTR|nr:hypothetical protein [Portunus trituberculatus]
MNTNKFQPQITSTKTTTTTTTTITTTTHRVKVQYKAKDHELFPLSCTSRFITHIHPRRRGVREDKGERMGKDINDPVNDLPASLSPSSGHHALTGHDNAHIHPPSLPPSCLPQFSVGG